MALLNLFKKSKIQENILAVTDDKLIYAPMKGKVISLNEIEDGVFSEEILGKGCGIRPAEGTLFAPFDGEIIQIADTKHAIGITSRNGIEILIHVGMDTVAMGGNGFSPIVKAGDKVRCGQLLMTFSIPEIEKSGYQTTTAVVITNSDSYQEIKVSAAGEVLPSDQLMEVN